MDRDPLFDSVKFLAIFMVVFWHVVGALCSPETYAGLHVVDNFRVGVDMPIFFAISGYFAASTIISVDAGKFIKHIRSYFWPFVVASILFAMLAVPFRLTSISGIPLYALKRFLFAGWFIWSLSICYALTFGSFWLARRIGVKEWKTVAVACLLFFLIPTRGVLDWHHFAYTRSQIGFFLFGAFVLRRWPMWRTWKIGLPALITYLVLAFLIPHFSAVGLSFYHANDVIYSFLTDRWSVLSFAARQLVGDVAVVGVLYAFSKVTRISWIAPKLATFGTTTLGVYILHHWILERIVTGYTNRVTGVIALLVALMLFASCHLVTKLTMNCPWSRIAMWGRFD